MARGYLDSPWPAEDGGARRLQRPQGVAGLHLQPGEALAHVARRTMMSTMTVLGAPGEVFMLRHSALRSRIGLPTSAHVERIDPLSLATQACSPRLPGGPMWPGGMALHRNGDLYVVYGRHAHRLDRQLNLLRHQQLPIKAAYNSFVVLANGLIVTKNLSDRLGACLTVLEPESLAPACADTVAPEASIARLSAVGNTVYVVGVRSIFRYHWDEGRQCLVFDEGWRHQYLSDAASSYGWDVVLTDRHAWFMDNGLHRYVYKMIGAGVRRTANRLVAVSLEDSRVHGAWTISGLTGGSITNPPLVDMRRGIVLAYDSANAFLRAWQLDSTALSLTPLWHKHPFGCASHMVLFEDSGEVVINDYRRMGEEVVVLDIESGREKGRTRIAGRMQGVVFPSAGWDRDVYWCSMDRVARVFVKPGEQAGSFR